MRIDPNTVPAREMYFTLVSLIVPRPIAWVSTVSKAGVPNLAPFSFFTGVTSKPPTLCICVGNKRARDAAGLPLPKDTARNAIDTGELVVNVVPHGLGAEMVLTSGEHPLEVDEIALAGLETMPSERVAPPRIVGTPAQLECTLHQVVDIADDDGRVTNRMLVARVEMVHIDDGVLGDDGRADPRALDPLGRLGGSAYTRLGELLEISRPKP